ncbi:Crp/Fnr family transcriptional regulator [Mucilaginibacter sp. UR6-11]|uniref:Crp/Fnr family transcriptional regulator n=1 Tax=Mucilaginibacter sp. UR6-11 TaxID=1435644 RepID=UPI001E5EA42B|nr:Crp/Fnr family transcriptional regulator [Mucilaginibacter sp. UR6-11]MCC8426595.1 Crp/Fnr family transcriptional regulator [Mucilaginibacter sp. UR6-11]
MNKPQKGCNLEKCFLCSNTVPEWRETINLHKQNLKFKKGEVIFSEGQPVKGIYFVYSGIAKVQKKWSDKELIIKFAADGAILGHRGLGSKMVYGVSATAVEPLMVCFVDIKFFEASLKTNSDLSYKLMVLFAEELDISERRMRDLAHMPVKGRVAQSLLSLEEQFGKDLNGNINLTLSRQDLAAFSASTYETVFRVIMDLTKDSIIAVAGKQIRIIERQKLIALTAGNPL